MMRRQRGFTLVEIAVVLVIIGLLLGGVLKGQELINSAKVKSLINDFRSVSTMIYAYQDRFRFFPGDDPKADDHVGTGAVATTPSSGDARGNGRIGGAWDSTTATDESYRLWYQLRKANLTTGSTDLTAPPADFLPNNAESGRIGVTGYSPIGSLAGSFFVCSGGITARFARQIDSSMDDGATDTGNVQVIDDNNAAKGKKLTATDESGSATYALCVAY